MNPPSLLELQRWMKWVIIHPKGAEAALILAPPLGSLLRFTVDAQSALDMKNRLAVPGLNASWVISETPSLRRAERLRVYAEGYFHRIAQALEEDFPRVKATVGEEIFNTLIVDYLKMYPSRSVLLDEVGAKLPDLISVHLLGERFPFLADLARLEWMMIEVFHTENPPPFELSTFGALLEKGVSDLGFKMTPSFRLFKSSYDLSQTEPVPRPGFGYLVRKGNRIGFYPCDESRYHALAALESGSSLNAVAATYPDLGTWLQEWLLSGLFQQVYGLPS